MLPKIIQNPKFVEIIYGKIPILEQVEIHSIEILRDGPSIRIKFTTFFRPPNPPKKWNEFNAVSFDILLIEAADVAITYFSTMGSTVCKSKRSLNENVLYLSGAVEAQFKYAACYVEDISGYVDERC